jgi:hypothetical protein
MKEFDDVKYIPMENGREYKGELFVKRENDRNLPDQVMAGVYATITAALNDLKDRGASDSVRFLLNDASYTNETFPLTVVPWAGASQQTDLSYNRIQELQRLHYRFNKLCIDLQTS